MRELGMALHHLKVFNSKVKDERYEAVINILESIFREEVQKLANLGPQDKKPTAMQRKILRLVMDNLKTDMISFDDRTYGLIFGPFIAGVCAIAYFFVKAICD
jgi:hypothetical protein